MQYNIILTLEKYGEIKIDKLIEILGSKENLVVVSECNALLYHPSFNPKRVKTAGLILTDASDNLDVAEGNLIKLNPDFSAGNLKLNTIPTSYKVNISFLKLESPR